MKLILTILSLLFFTLSYAQDYSKMSPFVRKMVTRDAVTNNIMSLKKESNRKGITLTFVQGDEEAIKGRCMRHQGDIHIVASTIDNIVEMSTDTRIKRIEANECKNRVTIDDATRRINATNVWEGIGGLPQAFKGKGTVIGISDIGFDLTHPAFRDAEGNLRISRFWDFLNIPEGKTYSEEDKYPIGSFFDDKETILNIAHSTDAKTMYHGTHTLGIATGNGWNTGLQGMAPEADLYVINEILTDNLSYLPEEYAEYATSAFNYLGFQYIFDYADEQGKPCVISYSVGGPQSINDGEILALEYLSRMTGEGHIFVASAGNSGMQNGYLHKGDDETIVGGSLEATSQNAIVCISTPKTITLRITNYKPDIPISKDIALDMPLIINESVQNSESGLIYGMTNKIELGDEFDNSVLIIYPMHDIYRDGRMGYDIKISGEKLPANKGYFVFEFIGENTEADIYVQEASLNPTNYNTALKGAEPHSGNVGQPGSLEPSISVGATAWRTSYKNIEGNTIYDNRGSNGERAIFSSCGPAVSGLIKPEIMAPGANISSAANSFCTTIQQSKVTSEMDFEGKTYQWMSANGTSMSTPFVAGTIALWLEADPTLTKERIIDVFEHSSKRYDSTLSYPDNYYGYGEIDAYRGLLYILNVSHVKEISQNHIKNAQINVDEMGNFSISLPSPTTSDTPLILYTPGGHKIGSAMIPAGVSQYSLSITQKGIVIMQVGDKGSTILRIP